jgi:hypothetical protein
VAAFKRFIANLSQNFVCSAADLNLLYPWQDRQLRAWLDARGYELAFSEFDEKRVRAIFRANVGLAHRRHLAEVGGRM